MAGLNLQKLGNNNSNSKEINFTTLGHKGLRDILRSHIMPQVGIEFRAVEKATYALWQCHSKRKMILRVNTLNFKVFLVAFTKKAPSVPNLHLDISQLSTEHQVEMMEYLSSHPGFFNTIKSISFPPEWLHTHSIEQKYMPIEFF